MLVLQLTPGEEVVLYDKAKNEELGKVKFIKPRCPDPNKIPFGFDLPANIQILRAELVEGGKDSQNNRKDARDGRQQTQ